MALLFIPIITFPFVYPAYQAAVWRWSIAGIRFGDARCKSDMRTGALMNVYWAVFGWSFLIIVADGIIVSVVGVTVASLFGNGSFDTAALARFANANIYVLYVANILNYLLIALVINAITRIYLLRGIWEAVANSTVVYGIEATDNVMAKGTPASALGEGFANSLDIAGF